VSFCVVYFTPTEHGSVDVQSRDFPGGVEENERPLRVTGCLAKV
jgi:hypothetical protein